jgi:hypothetical protein
MQHIRRLAVSAGRTSGFWDGEKVFLKNRALEIRNIDGRLHAARKLRRQR